MSWLPWLMMVMVCRYAHGDRQTSGFADRPYASRSVRPLVILLHPIPLSIAALMRKNDGSADSRRRDNMKGWHEHFDRKYIVCGELVEPGEGD